MPKKKDLIITLTVIGIILMAIGILVAILIAKGFFDSPDISYNAYLVGSDLITTSQPEFGLQFINSGEKEGVVAVKVSSNNKNVSFIQDEIARWVYPKKTDADNVNIEFEVNKSLFETETQNFTITFDIAYNGREKEVVNWKYYNDCPYWYSNCVYRWVK